VQISQRPEPVLKTSCDDGLGVEDRLLSHEACVVLLVDSAKDKAAAMDIHEYRELGRLSGLEMGEWDVELEDEAVELVRDGWDDVARKWAAAVGAWEGLEALEAGGC
jgi:hypothetical protein